MDPQSYEEGLAAAQPKYMQVPLFTKDSICKKCHFKYITIKLDREPFGFYTTSYARIMHPDCPRPTRINFDVIKRTCPQCGFSWNERPLDSESNNND